MAAPFLIAIMAGGEGRRMGGDKSTRMLGGRALIDHVLAASADWPGERVIGLHNAAQPVPEGHTVIYDPPGLEGPLAGLAAALATAEARECRHVLTLPCDMPFLPGDLPESLLAAIGEAGAAVPYSEDRAHWIAALWRADLGTALVRYAASGRRSLYGFAQDVGHVRVDWPGGAGDPFFNVNDAAGLAQAEARLAQKLRTSTSDPAS